MQFKDLSSYLTSFCNSIGLSDYSITLYRHSDSDKVSLRINVDLVENSPEEILNSINGVFNKIKTKELKALEDRVVELKLENDELKQDSDKYNNIKKLLK